MRRRGREANNVRKKTPSLPPPKCYVPCNLRASSTAQLCCVLCIGIVGKAHVRQREARQAGHVVRGGSPVVEEDRGALSRSNATSPFHVRADPSPTSSFVVSRVICMTVVALLPALCTSAALIGSGPATPYPSNSYDAPSARAYFARRPLDVITRAAQIGWKASGFASTLIGDALSGDGLDGPKADERGVALTNLLVELGPAFIKIGQSASVRTDLLPPPYVKALTSLQEDVPPFSTEEAREILIAELGASTAQSLLAGLSPEPIAAASLGQVYRGTFEGSPVAVKVQRPEITRRIALDMFLVREVAAPLASSLLGAPGDVAGIADAWGTGLVDELDYYSEAQNAAAFNERYIDRQLSVSIEHALAESACEDLLWDADATPAEATPAEATPADATPADATLLITLCMLCATPRAYEQARARGVGTQRSGLCPASGARGELPPSAHHRVD